MRYETPLGVMFVNVTEDERGQPFEVFINSKNMEHYAWTVALTRMISAVFRRGGDVSFVVEEMKAVFDPRGGAWMEGRYVPSLLAAIGDVIERHMIAIGFLPQGHGSGHALRAAEMVDLDAAAGAPRAGSVQGSSSGALAAPPAPRRAAFRKGPKCGEAALVRIENCDQCTSCDYSRCG